MLLGMGIIGAILLHEYFELRLGVGSIIVLPFLFCSAAIGLFLVATPFMAVRSAWKFAPYVLSAVLAAVLWPREGWAVISILVLLPPLNVMVAVGGERLWNDPIGLVRELGFGVGLMMIIIGGVIGNWLVVGLGGGAMLFGVLGGSASSAVRRLGEYYGRWPDDGYDDGDDGDGDGDGE